MSETTQYLISNRATGSAVYRHGATDGCYGIVSTANNNLVTKASFVSMDNDGFTINVSLDGGGGEAAYIAFA